MKKMTAWIKILTILGALGLFIFLFQEKISCSPRNLMEDFEALEEELISPLNLYDGTCAGKDIHHQYIAYLLKSEVKMYDKENNNNAQLINSLAEYLIVHSDDDGDEEVGWGLPWEWDAFGDGSMNPKDSVYAIEVANVIDALLDAFDSGVLNPSLHKKALQIMHDLAILWNTKYWTEQNETGRNFYWYSISKNDEIECTNISSKMAGTFSRLLRVPDLFSDEEQTIISDRIDQTISRVYELAYKDENNVLVWDYIPSSEVSGRNDLIHHAFVIEGIFDYNKYRATVDSKFSYEELTEYIYKCINYEEMLLYSYPDFSYERAFDTSAISFIENKELRRELLENSYERYCIHERAEDLQLSFLLDAMADCIVSD